MFENPTVNLSSLCRSCVKIACCSSRLSSRSLCWQQFMSCVHVCFVQPHKQKSNAVMPVDSNSTISALDACSCECFSVSDRYCHLQKYWSFSDRYCHLQKYWSFFLNHPVFVVFQVCSNLCAGLIWDDFVDHSVYWMTLLAAQSRVIVRSALRVMSAHCCVLISRNLLSVTEGSHERCRQDGRSLSRDMIPRSLGCRAGARHVVVLDVRDARQ